MSKVSDVFGDRKDELPQVLRLTQVRFGKFQLRQLGDAFDQFGNFRAEQALDVFAGSLSVLDNVVQQRRDDGLGVQTIVGEDAGHLDGVGKVGIAGRPLLGPVGPHRVDVGPVQQRLIGGGVVRADLFDQLELAQHFLPRRCRRRQYSCRYVGKRGGG